MSETSINIKKNKRIIVSAGIVLVLISFIYILYNCTFHTNFDFVHYINKNTGEQQSLASSLLVYLFLWVVTGLIPSACDILFMMGVYVLLHRKDKDVFNRASHPVYEEECDVIVGTALRATYAASAILFFLYMFGLISLNW